MHGILYRLQLIIAQLLNPVEVFFDSNLWHWSRSPLPLLQGPAVIKSEARGFPQEMRARLPEGVA
jgi:hypothetical protein